MPIILAIAILLFIFKGGIFFVFEKLFYAIIAIFEFFATLFSDISLKSYQKQKGKTRINRLRDIDKAYKEKNYKKVVSLYREVIGDDDYCNYETMKYCHIASDAVCRIAQTIPEYEEARTWTRIIVARDSAYKKEADDLFLDISRKGEQTLRSQYELFIAANEALEADQFDEAVELLNQMADNGSTDALIMLTDIGIFSMNCLEDIDKTKALLERLDAIDFHLSAELRKEFNEKPIVKYKEHEDKAKEYEGEAEKQHGMECINTVLRAIEEYKKAYEVLAVPMPVIRIISLYQSIAFEYTRAFPESRHIIEKALENLKLALKWADIYNENKYKVADEIVDGHRKNIVELIALLEKN